LHHEPVWTLTLVVALGAPYALGWYALLAGIEAEVSIILEVKVEVSPGSLKELTRFKGLVELVWRVVQGASLLRGLLGGSGRLLVMGLRLLIRLLVRLLRLLREAGLLWISWRVDWLRISTILGLRWLLLVLRLSGLSLRVKCRR
jgi:hypothetical protein